MDWWNVLIFGVIPVLTVTVIFFTKRKLLWIAPLISSALAFVTYMIALAPINLEKLFSNNEWRGFFILAILASAEMFQNLSFVNNTFGTR